MERAAEEQREARKRAEEERKRAAEEARLARIAELEKEKQALQAEIPTIKGLFAAGKIKKLQARVDEIEIKLTKLKQDCKHMKDTTISDFRAILKRMYSEENRERYCSLCNNTCSEDEERIVTLVKKFWPKEEWKRNSDFDLYEPNSELCDSMAGKYIDELNSLLDKLGWKK